MAETIYELSKYLLDSKTGILLILIFIGSLFFAVAWKRRSLVYEKQHQELLLYRMYAKPLEDLIKEIRAKQHEFDNHLSAILNMHITINNYEELVKAQCDYAALVKDSNANSYIGLLRISDKILAGFLYSKIISVKKDVFIEFMVGNHEVFTNVPENVIIEVLGTLIDNALEACREGSNQIKMFLNSEEDKLIFEIKNQNERLSIEVISRFFEKGFSTKSQMGKRGLGLYHAKKLADKWYGDIFVENEEIEGANYICFRVEL